MSDTVTPPPPDVPISDRDKIISDAKNLPDLLAKTQAADPDLYAKLTGATSTGLKAPGGSLVVLLVTWAAARYGLAWPPEVCMLVAGAIASAGWWVIHKIAGIPGIKIPGVTP